MRPKSGGAWEIVSGSTHSKMPECQLEPTGHIGRVEAKAAKTAAAVKAHRTKPKR